MNQVIKAVEQANTVEDVLKDPCFKIDADGLMRTVESTVYGRRFTRYLLIKLDYFYQDHAHRMSLETLSVEHVLPQTPADHSQWKRDFSNDDRAKWTDRLGNLVLISTKKNASQGRLDYTDKKTRYFSKNINTCPNSLRVLQNLYWTPIELLSLYVTNPVNSIYISMLYLLLMLYSFGVVKSFIQVVGSASKYVFTAKNIPPFRIKIERVKTLTTSNKRIFVLS
jgi:hypothetical protein